MKNFTRSLSLLALCISTISGRDGVVARTRIKPGLFTPGGTIEYGYIPAFNLDLQRFFLVINGKTTYDLALLKTLEKSNANDIHKILKSLVHLDAQGKLFDRKKIIIPDEISNLPIYKKNNSRLRRWFSSIDYLEHNVLRVKIKSLGKEGRLKGLDLAEYILYVD